MQSGGEGERPSSVLLLVREFGMDLLPGSFRVFVFFWSGCLGTYPYSLHESSPIMLVREVGIDLLLGKFCVFAFCWIGLTFLGTHVE